MAKTTKLKPLEKATVGGTEKRTVTRNASKRAKLGPTPSKKRKRMTRKKPQIAAAPPRSSDKGEGFGLGSIDLYGRIALPVGKDNGNELPDEVVLNTRQKITLLAAAPKMFATLVEVRMQMLPGSIFYNAITEALEEAYRAP